MNVDNTTRKVTLPWGPGSRVPLENLVDEAEVRTELDHVEIAARNHINSLSDLYPASEFSKDLDPSPDRILRTRQSGESKYALVIETTKGSGQKDIPVSLAYKGLTGSLDARAQWKNGELVSYSQQDVSADGQVTSKSIQVNDNGTLTYTTVGEKDSPPLWAHSS